MIKNKHLAILCMACKAGYAACAVCESDPALVNERLMSHEMGYPGECPQWATPVDLRLFSDNLSNGIYISSAKDSFVNGLAANYRGLEAKIKHELDADSSLTVNFAHEFASSNGPQLAAAGQHLPFSASPAASDIFSTGAAMLCWR